MPYAVHRPLFHFTTSSPRSRMSRDERPIINGTIRARLPTSCRDRACATALPGKTNRGELSIFFPGAAFWSPASLFVHWLVTFIARLLVPFRISPVISALKGGFHSIPADVPLIDNSAISPTLPRSIRKCKFSLNQLLGTSRVFVYITVPEKYLTPSLLLIVNDFRVSRTILSSDLGVFVELQESLTIPQYRLVHLQVEREARDTNGLPRTLLSGRILSAVYRIGAFRRSTGTPDGYGLRLLIEPRAKTVAASAGAPALKNAAIA